MFVKSSESEQLNLFSCASSSFSGKALSGYKNELGWHNLFRIMLAMMILKEDQGLSDANIFEQCRYNALTRSALGILN